VQSVYWFCLIIGGVFVALSLVGGDLLDDFDADADADFDLEADLDADFDADFDGDFDGDLDADADTDLQVDTDPDLLRSYARKQKRSFFSLSTLTSFKFWTFGGFFFGLTGLVMGALEPELGDALIFAIALIMGILCGGTLVGILRQLKHRQVDSLLRSEDFAGLVGVVEIPFDLKSKGKVTLEVGDATLHLVAQTDEERAFGVGDSVLVVGRTQDRLWVVSAENAASNPANSRY
jgi:membrane protein implicated in regulation of membrane protease activity